MSNYRGYYFKSDDIAHWDTLDTQSHQPGLDHTLFNYNFITPYFYEKYFLFCSFDSLNSFVGDANANDIGMQLILFVGDANANDIGMQLMIDSMSVIFVCLSFFLHPMLCFILFFFLTSVKSSNFKHFSFKFPLWNVSTDT